MRRGALICLLLLLPFLSSAALAQGNPFTPGSKPAEQPAAATPAAVTGGGWFVDLQRTVNKQLIQRLGEINRGSPTAILIGAGLAFLYGVFHAAGPGHGKVLVLSYFLGRDAHPWRGVLIGGQIALVHVSGAIVLAIAATVIMSGAAPQSVEDLRVVKLVSYATVAAIGLWLLAERLRAGGHVHAHAHAHAHGPGCHHQHHDEHQHGHTRRGIVISLAAGAVPCTGAVLVLLYCVANNIPLLGLGFVLLIGLGMAVTLTGFGLAGMFARRRALKMSGETDAAPSRWRRWLDLTGPALIVVLGAALFIGAY